MTQVKPRDGRKAEQWRRWLQRWRDSGLTVRAFCARHRLPEPRFYLSLRELLCRAAAPPAFVPGHAGPDPMQARPHVEVLLRLAR